MQLSNYRKFVVAIVGLVVIILHAEGVEIAEDVSNQVIAAATALAVFWFPNS